MKNPKGEKCMIRIWIPLLKIPSVTAQQKGIRKRKNGKPYVYTKQDVNDVRQLFQAYLCKHVPETPFEGPVKVKIGYEYFTADRKKLTFGPWGWKTTKPDCDNLSKLVLDTMTECGYWKDDSQVAQSVYEKMWVDSKNYSGILISVYTWNAAGHDWDEKHYDQ